MNLYEVIYLGSHGDADAEDTIYLVRASGFRAAIEHVQRNISASDHNGESGQLAHVVYEVGIDLSPYADSNHPCTLRGPYFAFATNYGWKSWERKIEGSQYTNEWEEKPNAVAYKSLQATRDGRSSSASRFASFGLACLSSGR